MYIFFFISLLIVTIASALLSDDLAITNQIWQQLGGDARDWSCCAVSCTAPYVKCSNDAVLWLMWARSNLTGTLSEAVAQLKSLERIYLFQNYECHGTIPRMPDSLQWLSIHGNQFSGVLNLNNLPSGMTQLMLHHNAFASEIVGDFPPNLDLLWLMNNSFQGQLPPIPAGTKNVRVWGNSFSGPLNVTLSEPNGVTPCFLVNYSLPFERSCFDCPVPPNFPSLCYVIDGHDELDVCGQAATAMCSGVPHTNTTGVNTATATISDSATASYSSTAASGSSTSMSTTLSSSSSSWSSSSSSPLSSSSPDASSDESFFTKDISINMPGWIFLLLICFCLVFVCAFGLLTFARVKGDGGGGGSGGGGGARQNRRSNIRRSRAHTNDNSRTSSYLRSSRTNPLSNQLKNSFQTYSNAPTANNYY